MYTATGRLVGNEGRLCLTSKQQVRYKARQARQALDRAYRLKAGEQIAKRVLPLISACAAQWVMLYAALADEVPTDALFFKIRQQGLSTAYPRVGEQQQLHVHTVSSLRQLRQATYGIREPQPFLPRVEPQQLDVVVVPGLAFDRHGTRLGYGEGYYDRFLLRAPQAIRIGLAYDCCVYDDIPSRRHDVPMHYIMTETQCIACVDGE